MQQPHHNLIQLIIGFPPFSQNRQTHITLLVNIRMQNLVQALDFRLRKWIVNWRLIAESDFRVGINSVLPGQDGDIQLSDNIRIGIGYFNVWNLILLVSQYVLLHSLSSSLWPWLLLLLILLIDSLLLKVLQHFFINGDLIF